jgi:hypothetical protein
MAGKIGLVTVHATCLLGTAALQCANGIIGGAVAGRAFDTEWYGYLINLQAVTAATLVVGGALHNSSGAVNSMVLNGQVTVDVPFFFPEPILNEFGPFTFTPSVSGVIWVFTRQYSGPEAPNAGGYEIGP